MILLREYNFMKIKPYFTKNRQFYENKIRKNNFEILLTQNLGILHVRSRARPKPLAKLGKIIFLSGQSFMEYIKITKENIDLEHKHTAASMAKKRSKNRQFRTETVGGIAPMSFPHLMRESIFTFYFIVRATRKPYQLDLSDGVCPR